jgi:two-component system, sensor histidine kinase and response regulator
MRRKHKGRVLVAEDDALVAALVQGILEDQGYEVVGVVGDGLSAVEVVEAMHPDVVLMDLQMPGMDGIEATRRIQASCPTPVVVLTAHEEPRLVQNATNAGVGAYLTKPPAGQDLEGAITVAQARFADMLSLRELNEELENRNAELGAFAHTVAHDLKNALSPIIGLAFVIGDEYDTFSADQIQHHLYTIGNQAKKLNRIIDELLLLAEVRDRDLVLMPVDMGEVVADVQSRLAAMVLEQGARVTVAPEWPRALGYGPWIEEVWANYLANALKYGGPQPRVELGWQAEPGTVGMPDGAYRFWVRDEGPGLTTKEQARLFVPFVQLSQVRAQGHGLGLSIVRRIVEKLGGTVGVDSAVGQGSTFWFTLPAVAGEAVQS